jgi:hypothetical protein
MKELPSPGAKLQAHVDISSKLNAFHGGLLDATHQHQQDALACEENAEIVSGYGSKIGESIWTRK